jgi:hypothetical protein
MTNSSTTVAVDLAYKSYADIGIAVLREASTGIEVTFPKIDISGRPDPAVLARYLVELCRDLGSQTVVLDGPQAWKDPSNGLLHSRICEKQLHTPAKTGVPGSVKPGPYRPFVEFSIATFDTLDELGWPRFTGAEPVGDPVSAEVFPNSAWKAVKLKHLPAKAKCSVQVLSVCFAGLCSVFPLLVAGNPTHDELQALVAGLAGPQLAKRQLTCTQLAGIAPYLLDGVYREGFILNPAAPGETT